MTLQLDDASDLATAFKEAFDGNGPSLVFDALWGEPGAAAALACAPNATIGNVGQSAGATAAFSSEAVRFKSLNIRGMSVYAVPSNVLAEQYRRLVDHAIAGDIRLDIEQVPLAATDAWRRQVDGAAAKLVVVP